MDSRFRAFIGQILQTGTTSPGKDQRNGFDRQLTRQHQWIVLFYPNHN
jgi:hypothetical protein